MDFKDVSNQLTDLPLTFQPLGPIFAGLIESLSAALARSTRAIDQISPNMINMPTARWGWLDAIGKLYGLPRLLNEIDVNYRKRLIGTLTATRGTPNSIVNFLKFALNINSTISENFSVVSYQLNFNTPVSSAQLQQVAIAIGWVRPAGVPFLPIFNISGGLYINTLNYLGNKFVTGSYLSRPGSTINVVLAANTDNPEPILPTNYIVDPYITGVAQINLATL